MYLAHFYCQNFRALAELHFEPGQGINVICGHNAQGKTSLLEAILYAATSKSHRTHSESELVRHGEKGFRLSAIAERADRAVTLDAVWHDNIKRFKINGIPQTRLSDILGKISVVLFSPEDIALVKGTASTRRRFLDMELSQISPMYLNALQRYRQALRQRNELLKTVNPDPQLLDVWDAQLAEFGIVLIEERAIFVGQLAQAAVQVYEQIAGEEKLRVHYAPNVAGPTHLAEVLARGRATDLRRQMTVHGPHRDDLELEVAGQPARNFASQGQQKSIALTLKLAALMLIYQRTGEYPLLMLDEVLSELDEKRSRRLFAAIPAPVQCLLTTTNSRPDILSSQNGALFRIEAGVLKKNDG